MSRSLTLVTLLALFLAVVLGDSCLSSLPPLSKGEGCGGALSCSQDNYCSKEGVCKRKIKEGEDCKDAVCEFPLVCKGPTDFQRCYAPVHPGEDCSSDLEQTGPTCGTGNCINNRCSRGLVGDACLETGDCLFGLTCSEKKICTGIPNGSSCNTTLQCQVGSGCHPTTNLCTALPTSGNCTLIGCAPGYFCQKIQKDDQDPSCVALESVMPGQLCLTDEVCSSLLCGTNGYCAEKSPLNCQMDGECAADESCLCDGKLMVSFPGSFGSCKADPCAKSRKNFLTCMSQSCNMQTINGDYSPYYFDGSCIELNCDKEFKKLHKCSPASSLFVSLSSVAFFVLLTSFFARHL